MSASWARTCEAAAEGMTSVRACVSGALREQHASLLRTCFPCSGAGSGVQHAGPQGHVVPWDTLVQVAEAVGTAIAEASISKARPPDTTRYVERRVIISMI